VLIRIGLCCPRRRISPQVGTLCSLPPLQSWVFGSPRKRLEDSFQRSGEISDSWIQPENGITASLINIAERRNDETIIQYEIVWALTTRKRRSQIRIARPHCVNGNYTKLAEYRNFTSNQVGAAKLSKPRCLPVSP
jgi:hypothetical protein